MPPTVFIPVAEKIGLINALGEWVLKTACAEAASWATPLKVSVNVSPIQLMNTSLTDTIIEVLHQTGLDPRRLDLEITESDVFNENTRSLEILSQLREQGIQISIDDFGTGYSSLSRLSYFPFDKIKIDPLVCHQYSGTKRRSGYRPPDYQHGKEPAYAHCGGRCRDRRAVGFAAGAGL
ncbi:Bacteriophytochrome cph2 [Klebsiella aerogenes]|nr:Bacteriophytochrome cph2 [Klebsiella aerogenes]